MSYFLNYRIPAYLFGESPIEYETLEDLKDGISDHIENFITEDGFEITLQLYRINQITDELIDQQGILDICEYTVEGVPYWLFCYKGES